MAESENLKKGREVRRKLMGDAMVEKMAKAVYDDPIMNKFGDYASEAVFGMLWTRPGLDLKTRTLICVVSDTATARWPELKIHLRMARRQGWTEDELSEVLLHLSGYIGLPWSRPGLDFKTRALICVVSDTATARWPELKIHLRMARRQGWSEDELSEVLLHLTGYLGAPSVREAMITAKEVFAELRKEK